MSIVAGNYGVSQTVSSTPQAIYSAAVGSANGSGIKITNTGTLTIFAFVVGLHGPSASVGTGVGAAIYPPGNAGNFPPMEYFKLGLSSDGLYQVYVSTSSGNGLCDWTLNAA